jgi:hypothetical protein
VHRHELQGILARPGLALTRFQARMGEERGENLLLGRAGNPGDVFLRLARGLEAVLEVLGEENRRVDELVQVLEAVLPVLLRSVVILEPASLEDLLDQLRERQRLGGCLQRIDDRHELRDRGSAAPGHEPGARDVHEAAHALLGRLLQLLDGARADSTRREIHHARERGVVVGIGGEAQVGHRVLYFHALEEA